MLDKSYQVLRDYKTNPVINTRFLRAVAGVRFSMMEVAEVLHNQIPSDITKPQQLAQLEFTLIQLTQEVCTDPAINSTDFAASDVDVVGPAVYLLKLLVRTYGFACLKEIFEQHKWIIPEGLRSTDQVSYCMWYTFLCVDLYRNFFFLHMQEKVIDPFVMYSADVHYSALREAISTAVFAKQIANLDEATKVCLANVSIVASF